MITWLLIAGAVTIINSWDQVPEVTFKVANTNIEHVMDKRYGYIQRD